MENRTPFQPSQERLLAELARQLEAYDQSLVNDESREVRKNIALRIVEIEKSLVHVSFTELAYHNLRYRYLHN